MGFDMQRAIVALGRIPRAARTASALAAVAAFVHATSASALAPGFYDLGVLPGGDAFLSTAEGVSGNGRVVVGQATFATDVPDCCVTRDDYAFRWTEGVFTLIQPVPYHELSVARAASYDGSVVTGNLYVYSSGLWEGGWVWVGDTVTPLGSLPGGSNWSAGRSVSADGTVIAGHSVDAITDRAMRWDAGVMTNLGTGTGYSYAYGVSGDGNVVVGYQLENGAGVPKRWDGLAMSALPLPPGAFGGIAYGISADASVIVGRVSLSAGPQATRWDAVGPQLLGMLRPSDTESRALDASGDGSTVVGWSYDRFIPLPQVLDAYQALIWTEAEGSRPLEDVLENDYGFDLTGWRLQKANAISDDGRVIVGTGINPDLLERGWIAVLAEAPACNDGADNDGDGRVDYPGDPGCVNSLGVTEIPQCQDGVDNDAQAGIDSDGGASLDLDEDGFIDSEFNSETPAVGDPDPQCPTPWLNQERSGCGMGFELLLLAPLLVRLTRKRRA